MQIFQWAFILNWIKCPLEYLQAQVTTLVFLLFIYMIPIDCKITNFSLYLQIFETEVKAGTLLADKMDLLLDDRNFDKCTCIHPAMHQLKQSGNNLHKVETGRLAIIVTSSLLKYLLVAYSNHVEAAFNSFTLQKIKTIVYLIQKIKSE